MADKPTDGKPKVEFKPGVESFVTEAEIIGIDKSGAMKK
jgi:hypothetical protein